MAALCRDAATGPRAKEVGGTGYQPVPPGYQPGGREGA